MMITEREAWIALAAIFVGSCVGAYVRGFVAAWRQDRAPGPDGVTLQLDDRTVFISDALLNDPKSLHAYLDEMLARKPPAP